MESSLVGLDYVYAFRDLVKVVKNPECAFILPRDDKYIHQTKNDGLYGYQKVDMVSSIE